MISYAPFYRTHFRKRRYRIPFIYKQGFSANILHRMKHGKTITLKTLDTLCFILNCSVSDIIEYTRMNKRPSEHCSEAFFLYFSRDSITESSLPA